MILLLSLLNIFSIHYLILKKLITRQSSYSQFIRITALFVSFSSLLSAQTLSKTETTYICHSCLAQCKLLEDGSFDPIKCDCGNGGRNETCIAENCFVKLELFFEEMVGIVQKGCIHGLPNGTEGCSYSGQAESTHCYCKGDLCNEKTKLNNYLPAKLPVIECCECGGEQQQEQCPKTDIFSEDQSSTSVCSRTCKGNYCLVDFGGNEQGCGKGVPRLQNFLRIPNYLNQLQGQLVCAYYQASSETIVNGCVCTEPSGNCNQRNRTWNRQMQQVLGRRTDDLNFCYSLHARSEDEPITEEVYKKSATCEGHFCFASLSTREMVVETEPLKDGTSSNSFIGVSKQRFELLGGCLKVDDDKKVGVGCTIEYLENSSEPLSVHCICDSHLCNYFELLQKATNGQLKVQKLISSSAIELKQGDSSFTDLQIETNKSIKESINSKIAPFLIIFIILKIILPNFIFLF